MLNLAQQLEQHRQYLPQGYELVDYGGQILYPTYTMSGGLSTKAIFYLVHDGRVLGVRISKLCEFSASCAEEALVRYVDRAIQFGIDNFDKHAIPLNLDGGDLGFGIDFTDKDSANA